MEEELIHVLNPAQRQAVEAFTGPILVVAGAGTGKTRVLEYRALRLIQKGVDPLSILLLTFTRRAAQEMISRAARHDPRLRLVAGGTFHSFALEILKRYGKLLGFNNSFSVLDRGDNEDLVGKIISDLNLSVKKYFPKKTTVAEIISKAVNKELSVGEVLVQDYEHFLEWEEHLELVKAKFAKYKLEHNLLDYDDLLIFLYQLLEKFPHIQREITNRFRFIMVDEYQDTNKLQAKIIYKLGENHQNVLIVGDEMQSIYAFRGANYLNMFEFPKMFPQARKITLEENYRSTQEILDVANGVLDQVEGQVFKKYLFSARNGQKPLFLQFKSEKEEASWVTEKILELASRGIPLRKMAVLFRAAYQSASLEIELASRGIPFKKFGGIRFIETAHVKDVLAHLKVLVNPKDELALRRILLLVDGVGEKTAEEIIRFASWRTNFRLENLKKLFDLLEKIKDKNLKPAEKIAKVIDYYLPILRQNYDDYPQREQDLKALMEIALNYEEVDKMLADFALEPPDHSAAAFFAKDSLEDWLCLSTVHSAKGLEWQTVFIIQLQEGKFPLSQALKSQEELEEERRLFYVAVTRAKENLFLSAAYGQRRIFSDSWYFNKPSRFVIPLIEKGVLEAKLDEREALNKRVF